MREMMKRNAVRVAVATVALWGCSSSSTNVPGEPGVTTTPPAAVGEFVTPQANERAVYPVRLAVAGDVTYVTDSNKNQVLGLRDGVAVVKLTGLDKPLGIAVSGDKLYVGNHGRQDVEVYSLSAKKYLYALGGGTGAFVMPNDIAVAPNGTVFVADSKAHTIKAFGADGAFLTRIGTKGTGVGELYFPSSVAADATRVVVGDQGNKRVQIFDHAGAALQTVGGPLEGALKNFSDYRGRFTLIQSVALQGDDILVLDSYHAYVQVFGKDGTAKGIFGRAGDCANCVKLALDIAVNSQGDVLATDPQHRRLVSLSQEMR